MAGGVMSLGEGFPSGTGTPEQQVKQLRGYVLTLMENLRYILANLDSSNFSEAGLGELGNKLEVDTVISREVITNELYANYGMIAKLVVDELRTDYCKAQKYLDGDTSEINYLHIHDEQIDFINATTDGESSEQLTIGEYPWTPYYWTDSSCTQMSASGNRSLPVMTYQYTELVKASFYFEETTYEIPGETEGDTQTIYTKMPVLRFGAGNGSGGDYGCIYKDKGKFVVKYVNGSGAESTVEADESGFWRVNGLGLKVVDSLEELGDDHDVLYIVSEEPFPDEGM